MTGAAEGELAIADAVIAALAARSLVSLLNEICRQRGVLVHEVCGRTRTLGACRARQELWWRIQQHPDRRYSYCEIGRLFGRDHTTVLHGVAAHRKRTGAE